MLRAYAQSSPTAFTDAAAPLIYRINEFIINPLIWVGFGWAVIIFFWGLYEFIRNTDSDEGREKGKLNIFYGIIGILIMVSVYGIINFLLVSFGIDKPTILPR